MLSLLSLRLKLRFLHGLPRVGNEATDVLIFFPAIISLSCLSTPEIWPSNISITPHQISQSRQSCCSPQEARDSREDDPVSSFPAASRKAARKRHLNPISYASALLLIQTFPFPLSRPRFPWLFSIFKSLYSVFLHIVVVEASSCSGARF